MKMTLDVLLKGHQFCLLTTFRKDGTPVPTAMWFAFDGQSIVMSTRGGAAKVKRLRRDTKATIGPCNGNGVPLGEQVEAVGRVIDDPSEQAVAERQLKERYGIKRRLLLWGMSFSRDKSQSYLGVALA